MRSGASGLRRGAFLTAFFAAGFFPAVWVPWNLLCRGLHPRLAEPRQHVFRRHANAAEDGRVFQGVRANLGFP